MTTISNPELFIRQTALANPEKLGGKILVIGAGGIGSWTSLSLLKMGCSDVTVMDFDTVEIHNVGSQLYGSWDTGKTKLEALGDRLSGLAETLPTLVDGDITEMLDKLDEFDTIISAVDSITVRKTVFEALKGTQKRFIDGRMAGNAIEIYSVPMDNKEATDLYEETLFTEEESLHIECSSRAVIYNCFIIAGFIADIVAQWSNNNEVPVEILIDLSNFTLFN